jgi:hypothetical protein
MPLAEPISTVPPRERTVVEGNIVEHPIWKLSNRQARPKRLMVDAETGKVLVDPRTLKPREYVDPADCTQEFDLGPDPIDGSKRRQLVIKADVHAGFPTVHALRVLVVVAEKAHFSRYASQKVPITPSEIARGLRIEHPPTRTSTPSTTPWMPSKASSSSTSTRTSTCGPGPFIPAAALSASSRRPSSGSGHVAGGFLLSMTPRAFRSMGTTSSSAMACGRA